ncbi:MAG: hypothetical protein LBO70_02265 [Clostridiales Family XIII bacterium]|jgi:hypothetical protein|nr:hypothetical protein [Clostridiales Family XIII bacterium]
MANKNKRTKARREKEIKEAKQKKVAEKPIHKRPWIWIALAALVIGIVVPSVYQHNKQVIEETEARQERESLVWESVLTAMGEMGVTESAISGKSFDIRSSANNDTYDYALATVVTDVRTLVASSMYDSTQNAWVCTQITNEDGSHIYWTYFNQGVENATQAAVVGANGAMEMQPIYDYATDEPVPGATTGAAVETPTDAAVE